MVDENKNENDIIVFDIETKKSFDDVGGRDNMHLLGVSVVAAYSYNQKKFFAFDESKIDHFGKLITAWLFFQPLGMFFRSQR